MAILNELNTLEQNLETAKTTLSTNLNSKGVTDSKPSDTITKMAADVLTISESTKIDLRVSKIKFANSEFSQLPDFVDWTLPMPSNMSYMFDKCQALTSIPQLDTSNVTEMTYAFRTCHSLQILPVMHTELVFDMTSMIDGCTNLLSTGTLNISLVEDYDNFLVSARWVSLPKLRSVDLIGLGTDESATSWPTAKELTNWGG